MGSDKCFERNCSALLGVALVRLRQFQKWPKDDFVPDLLLSGVSICKRSFDQLIIIRECEDTTLFILSKDKVYKDVEAEI